MSWLEGEKRVFVARKPFEILVVIVVSSASRVLEFWLLIGVIIRPGFCVD